MKISIIGSGNVAWHFASRLAPLQYTIEILHRSPLHQHWEYIPNLSFSSARHIDINTELVLIAVSDRSIEYVINDYSIPIDSVVVHTSGAVDISILETGGISSCGVFYPLQSLRAGKEVNEIPILLEGKTASTIQFLTKLARSMNLEARLTDSVQRRRIHTAAVFASNFINHMLSVSEETLKDVPLELLKPLVENTVEKAFTYGPKNSQTGPAIRNDKITMRAHLEVLSDKHEKELYKIVSQHIQKVHGL